MAKYILSLLEIILLNTPLALGVVLAFKIAKFPDLTIDGSFTVGAVFTVILVKLGKPYFSIPVGFLAGCAAGFLTAMLHVYFKLGKILSGILITTSIFSINLILMGKSNIQIINDVTSITWVENISRVYVLLFYFIISLISFVVLLYFLNTEIGLHFRACGVNPNIIKNLGRDQRFYILLGPILANGFVGLSGSLIAQYQGFADVNMGIGSLITGLAILFIGESFVRSIKLHAILFSAFIGTIFYQFIISISLRIGLPQELLKILTATIVILSIMLGRRKNKLEMSEDLI